ncbi:hypothetical protein Tco_0214837 [Tanacetum coccineum]
MVQQHYYQAPVANHSLLVHLQSYQPLDVHQPSQASFPLMDSGLVVPSFLPSNDPIASLNKVMDFISTAFTSRYPPTNNQLRTSSNPRKQATIQDGRVQVQTVHGRQNQGYEGSGARSNATSTGVNNTGGTNTIGQAKALESRVVLDEEHMAFLADNRDTVTSNQQSQEIPTPTAFQTDDLDAFDSNYDEATSASVVLMANLSSYDSDILLEVPSHDNYPDNHVIDQNGQEIQYSKQPDFNNNQDIDITSDSNMISYEQYLNETENTVVQDTFSSTQNDAMIMSVIEEMSI